MMQWVSLSHVIGEPVSPETPTDARATSVPPLLVGEVCNAEPGRLKTSQRRTSTLPISAAADCHSSSLPDLGVFNCDTAH
jgi:hypothetical protein